MYDCQKFRNKPLASITVLDVARGLDFIARYGVPMDARRNTHPSIRLIMNMMNRNFFVLCSPSRNPPTEMSLQSLQFESRREAQRSVNHRHTNSVPQTVLPGSGNRALNSFATATFACGVWSHYSGRLTFVPYAVQNIPGKLLLGARQAVILLKEDYRIDINYFTVDTVLTGSYDAPTVTFTLNCPPKFYRHGVVCEDIAQALARLSFGLDATPIRSKKTRIRGISTDHEAVAGTCFVYQVRLANYQDLPKAFFSISHIRTIPSAVSFPTFTHVPTTSLVDKFTRLNFEITTRYVSLSYGLKFQALRLAQNSKLAPDKVRSLLPVIVNLSREHGEAATVEAIRRLYLQMEPAGPQTHANDYSEETVAQLLGEHAQAYESYRVHSAYDLANRHLHIVLIHKIEVTPTAVYLQGPEPEVTNRVSV